MFPRDHCWPILKGWMPVHVWVCSDKWVRQIFSTSKCILRWCYCYQKCQIVKISTLAGSVWPPANPPGYDSYFPCKAGCQFPPRPNDSVLTLRSCTTFTLHSNKIVESAHHTRLQHCDQMIQNCIGSLLKLVRHTRHAGWNHKYLGPGPDMSCWVIHALVVVGTCPTGRSAMTSAGLAGDIRGNLKTTPNQFQWDTTECYAVHSTWPRSAGRWAYF